MNRPYGENFISFQESLNENQHLARFSAAVEARLAHWLPASEAEFYATYAQLLQTYPVPVALQHFLLIPLRDISQRGGKRFRTRIIFLCSRWLPREEHLVDLAASVEILHSALLILDDVQDHAQQRRGRSTLHRLYGPEIALNAAYLGLFLVPLIVSRLSLSQTQELRLYRALHSNLFATGLGQGADLVASGARARQPTLAEYENLCKLKTGALFRLCYEMVAIAGDLPWPTNGEVSALLQEFGLLFQMRDDLLGVQPLPEAHQGKDFAEDLRERKYTLPFLLLWETAQVGDRKRISRLLSQAKRSSAALQEILELFHGYGIFAQGKALLEQRAQQLESRIAGLPLPLRESMAHLLGWLR